MTGKELFGRTFRLTVLGIVFFELLSLLAHWFTVVNTLSFVVICAVVLAVSLYKLEYGLYVALVELFIGSKGHLFALQLSPDIVVSIRIGIFVAVLIAWLIRVCRSKKTDVFRHFAAYWYLALAAAVLVGVLTALVNGHAWQSIFLDLNSWFYFAYIGVFVDTMAKKEVIKRVWQIFTASLLTVALKSLIVLYIFSHNFPTRSIYKWIRDTGVGEITLLAGDFYRVFFQSHIFMLIGFFVMTAIFLFRSRFDKNKKHDWYLAGMMVLTMTVTFISLSRSNWVGFVLAMGVLYGVLIWLEKAGWRKIFRFSRGLIGIGLLSLILIVTVVLFPYPKGLGLDAGETLKQRFQGDEAAVSSRWSQLPILTSEVAQRPILGFGWGKSITYQSQDPRILQDNPDGTYETFAFEWGYLDIMLKIGLLGLLIYLGLLFRIWQFAWRLLQSLKDSGDRAVVIGLLLGLLSLMITHAFSPYLNHPLGIGYILFVTGILQYYGRRPNSSHQKTHLSSN